MTILVVVLAIFFVLVVSAVTMRRRRGDEAHSVAGYRRTLDTLAGLGEDRLSGTRRLLGGRLEGTAPTGEAPAEGRAGVPGRPGPGPGPGPAPGPSPDRRWVFDDVGSRSGRRAARSTGPTAHRIGRATWGPARGARSRTGLAVAATVVVLVVVVAVALLHGHHPKANGAGAAGTAPAGSHGSHGTHHGTHHGTTTTTVPAREQPVSSTPTTATYVPPASAYALTLAATTGNCWVQVTNASGTTVFAQTLAAGTRHVVTVSGRVTVLLGAPTVATVTVDRAPAVLPTGYRSPFTMTFTPSTAGSAG